MISSVGTAIALLKLSVVNRNAIMNKLTLIAILVVCSQLFACQSTKVAYTEKRPVVSDHQLLLTLLNRPVPKDQQMMLAFTRQYHEGLSQLKHYSPIVVPVAITGEKRTVSDKRPEHQFSYLINQDKNSILINGPI